MSVASKEFVKQFAILTLNAVQIKYATTEYVNWDVEAIRFVLQNMLVLTINAKVWKANLVFKIII